MLKKLCALLLALACLLGSAGAETLTMTLLGDCTIGGIDRGNIENTFTKKVSEKGMDYCFSDYLPILSADDITLANCEVVFTDRKKVSANKLSLRATAEWAEMFVLGSVEVVNTHNNHTMDFGKAGFADTIAALDAQNIAHFGGGELYVTTVKGIKIGMTGYTYPHHSQIKRQTADIKTLRDMGCDVVIVSMHWGKEEKYVTTLQQRTLGPELIDAGADIVFGHGPHVLQPIQIYNGKPIFYSLGNFVFGGNPAPKDPDVAAIQIKFDMDGGTFHLRSIQAFAGRQHNKSDYRPYQYTAEKDQKRVYKKLMKSWLINPSLPDSFYDTGYAEFE